MIRVGATPVGLGFAVAIWLLGQFLGQLADPPAPDRPVEADALPRSADSAGSGGRIAQLAVDRGRRGDVTTGTVWHVGDRAWLSNRHVLERCATHELHTQTPAEVERLWAHPDADLAAVRTASTEAAVGLAGRAPERGSRAYAIGYPQGEPGIAELSLRSEGRMQLTGALSSDEPFRYKVWSVRSLPDHVATTQGLGGISGGTVINDNGEAIGTVFGGNNRRGTLFTIPYAEVRAAADALTEARLAGGPGAIDDPRDYAERVLASDRVARVLCRY